MNIGREIGGISIRSDNSPLPLANVSSAKAAALIVEAWGNAPGIVLRRRRCLIISPPRDGFAVANLGQRPRTREVRTTSAESAIHEELSYSPAQFRKVDQPAPSPQSSPRKRGEPQYFMQSSILSRGAGVDFDERYAWD